MRNALLLLTWLALGGVCFENEARCNDMAVPFVRISPRDPHYFETDDGRPYVPNGLNVISPPWLRSRQPSDRLAALWKAELAEGTAPAPLRGMSLDLNPPSAGRSAWRCRVYDPWTDHWSDLEMKDGRVALPEFTRSIVVKMER
jgi:hypothetical protein